MGYHVAERRRELLQQIHDVRPRCAALHVKERRWWIAEGACTIIFFVAYSFGTSYKIDWLLIASISMLVVGFWTSVRKRRAHQAWWACLNEAERALGAAEEIELMVREICGEEESHEAMN
jgi:hypothetical protein